MSNWRKILVSKELISSLSQFEPNRPSLTLSTSVRLKKKFTLKIIDTTKWFMLICNGFYFINEFIYILKTLRINHQCTNQIFESKGGCSNKRKILWIKFATSSNIFLMKVSYISKIFQLLISKFEWKTNDSSFIPN